jgi:hypothetical protein
MYEQPKHKAVLKNGRDSKRPLSFEECWTKVPVQLVAHSAWRHLTASAKDVLLVFRIKSGIAAAKGIMNSSGLPEVDFTYAEAAKVLQMTSPTFTRVVRELQAKGFIALSQPGGILNGKGRPARYTLSNDWQDWQPTPASNANIYKARASRRSVAP